MIQRASRLSLLLGAAFVVPFFAPVGAQQPDQPGTNQPTTAGTPGATTEPVTQPADEYGDEDIVITGQRARGSVVGDIPPERTYDSRDVRATGATNINELLDALAPELGSSRGSGGQPVLLLNGQRISSFRELRDIPTEAISRVEILPEEVALKYGYRADQRVVNIVLRQRFRSTVALASGSAATDGGYFAPTGDLTRLIITREGRTTLNLHAEGNGILTEAERDVLLSEPPPAGATEEDVLAARSLVPSRRDIRGSATINRQVLGNVSATLNTEFEHSESRSLIGLGDTLLAPLARNATSDTAHLGTTLNWDKGGWHWNIVGNADLERDVTKSDVDDPGSPRDRARTTTASGDLSATANGNLFKLPAGDASATFKVGGDTQHLDGEHSQDGLITSNSLSRTTGDASASIDLPISRRNRDFSALGNLTLNANAEVDHLSDFGTLTTLGAGVNWSPVDRLNFIGSWTREEGAPTIHQLGDPVLVTENTRVFDFTRDETVLVTATTGGNADLLADRRNVFKLGANWQPFANVDLRLRADYVHTTTDNPISNITVTEAIEEAFPDRFIRDSSGQLVRVDLRPVNFDRARKDTLRLGLSFDKKLKSRRPSQSVIDQIRAQFGRSRPGAPAQGQNAPTSGAPPEGATQGGPPPGPPPEAGGPPSEGGFGRGGGGRGFGGGGGFFGGGSRGRLQFSLTDTITFVDKVKIQPGVPELDYLHGDAAGSTGGTPRHQIQGQAGWSNNGLGARLSANWQSGTTINNARGDNLRFSPLGTFDLRLFANPGDIPEVAVKHPWLRGTQLRLDIKNMFNAKQNVRDAAGIVPLNYQPDLLDPLGRTIKITFRKLFLPPPSFFQRQRQQEQQAAPSGGED
jgi:hypothetical protein